MTNQFSSGLDALNALMDEGQGEVENKFTSFKSGDSRVVKIIDAGDVKDALTYSSFKNFHTFSPKNPPKLSRKGFPVEDLTVMDLAWQYHQNRSEKFGDDESQEAMKYRIKQRFAFGFYDLDDKEFIVIDFSANQAKALYAVIKKQHEQGRLGKRAFILEKTGAGTQTQVSLTPEPVDDLTDKQQKAFEEAPKEFDKNLFENLYFVQDEEQMLETLTKAGFDVSLIGFDKQSEEEKSENNPFEGQKTYDDLNAEDPTQQF